MSYLFEPRSKDWYDDDETDIQTESTITWFDVVLFPVRLVFLILIAFLISMLPLLFMIGCGLTTVFTSIKAKASSMPRIQVIGWLAWALLVLGILVYTFGHRY